jgi:hypothetical protein
VTEQKLGHLDKMSILHTPTPLMWVSEIVKSALFLFADLGQGGDTDTRGRAVQSLTGARESDCGAWG